MQRNDARLQMLTLALFAVLALLSVDLAPVQAVMDEYGLIDQEEEAFAEENPTTTPWVVEGPSLAVGGRKAPEAKAPLSSPCCGGEIAIDGRMEDRFGQWTEALAGIQISQMPAEVPQITSMWPEERATWTSVDAAAKDLDLSDHQRDSWGRTLEDAKRDLDDLRHVPNAEGRTWHSITTASYDDRGELRSAVRKAHAMAEFLTTELNGGETYAGARRRLLDSYKDRLRGDLTPSQQEIFDGHDVDPLMDDSPVLIAVSVFKGPRRSIRLQTLRVSKA